MDRTDLVARAVRLALATSLAGLATLAPANAQDDADDVAIGEPVVVTGTRIKRAEVEGPLPVTIITREQIDASGEVSVAELLRTQTFNTFGSPKQMSGPSNLGGSVNSVEMRGLAGTYTLVLVNGRRFAANPMYDVGTQNLSVIPLAAVERIEVLRDGASAIYGTEAIAGVVNIILRRDYMGMHLAYDIGRPDQPGGDEDSYSVTGGIGSDRGNITFGMDVQKKEIVYRRDRDFTSNGLSRFGFPSTYTAWMGEEDPRNPTGDFLTLGTFPDPRCPEALGTDPEFPWSEQAGDVCAYAYWGEMADEASNDTKSFFLDSRYEINGRTEFFARGLFSLNEVEGRYAPSPTLGAISMDRNSPGNPTNPATPTNYLGDAFDGQAFDLDTDDDGQPDVTVEGPFDVDVYYRNVPGGNRDHEWDDTLVDYLAGIRGTTDWLSGVDWELAAQWSEQQSNQTAEGKLITNAFATAIDQGDIDVFGVRGPLGDVGTATGTSNVDARHRITGGDGQIAFDAMQWDNGPVPVVLGFEYRDEEYDLDSDEQTAAGGFVSNIEGLKVSGAGTVKSLFAETALPLLPSLELSLAGRYDDYSHYGTTFNPKASIAFRPLDSLLLRSSAGTGFWAQATGVSVDAPWEEYAFFIDTWGCAQTDADTDGDGRPDVDEELLPEFHPCRRNWYEWSYGGYRDIEPEKSDNLTLGMVWSPTHDLSLTVDYYRIELKDKIDLVESQTVLDREFRARQAGATGSSVLGVIRDDRGRFVWGHTFFENIGKTDTDGLDIEANYALTLGRFGEMSTRLNWTRVLNFKQEIPDFTDKDRVGDIGFPRDRAQLTVNWSLGDFAATAVGNYISEQDSTHYYGAYVGEHLASFTTWDLQASYTTPWNARITVGARNAFDRDPPHYRNGSEYDMRQYEVYGRVPYLRLEADF